MISYHDIISSYHIIISYHDIISRCHNTSHYAVKIIQRPEMGRRQRSWDMFGKLLLNNSTRVQWNGSQTSKINMKTIKASSEITDKLPINRPSGLYYVIPSLLSPYGGVTYFLFLYLTAGHCIPWHAALLAAEKRCAAKLDARRAAQPCLRDTAVPPLALIPIRRRRRRLQL